MNLSFIIKKIDILIPICTFSMKIMKWVQFPCYDHCFVISAPDVYSDLKLRLKSNETRQMLNRPEILSFTIPQVLRTACYLKCQGLKRECFVIVSEHDIVQ